MPLLFKYDMEYAIMKVQDNQAELKMNRTHQFMAYADDVNLLEDYTDTIQETHRL
jgi:hypothetical protein